MPCHSNSEDKKSAYNLAKYFGFRMIEFDLTDIYDLYVEKIKKGIKVDDKDLIDANINLKPRLRTATLYYYASMLSHIENETYIVPGTSNACELYVGYFTKGGDNISDILVLADLTVDEVIKIGKYIGVPESIVNKTPNDGLSGMSDEEKLGVTYKDITKVINKEEVNKDIYKKIKDLHDKNNHKFNTPIYRKK